MSDLVNRIRATLYHALRGSVAREPSSEIWRSVRESQWKSRSELLEDQDQKLKVLLILCRDNVPYYSDLLKEANLEGADADGHKVLCNLPIVDKPLIREKFDLFKASNARDENVKLNSTSGSTGENFQFLMDWSPERRCRRMMMKFRGKEWCGVDPFSRAASLWGASFDAPKKDLRSCVGNLLQPHLFLSSYKMGSDQMELYARKLTDFSPSILTSYPGPLEQFSKFCLDRKLSFPSLMAVMTSSEQLFPHQRELAEKAFGVPVFNRYGCREFGDIAMECEEHKGLHIFTERVILEVVDWDGKPCEEGEVGELVVTDLDNFAMPLVRYRVGDRGRLTSRVCKCGRQLPLLESIEGRVFDVITTSSGKRVSGTFWTLLSRYVSENIVSFQIRQNSADSIRVYLQMLNGPLTDQQEQTLRERITSVAPELEVSLEYVVSIEPSKSGKRKFVVRDDFENQEAGTLDGPVKVGFD